MADNNRFDKIEEKIDKILEKISTMSLSCVLHSEKIAILWKAHEKKDEKSKDDGPNMVTIWKVISGLVGIIAILAGYNKF